MKIFIKSIYVFVIMTGCLSSLAQNDATNTFRSKINIGVDFMPNMTVFKDPSFQLTIPLANYDNNILATGFITKVIVGYKLSPRISVQAGFLYSMEYGRYIYEPTIAPQFPPAVPLTLANVIFYKIDHTSAEFIAGIKYYFIKRETRFKPYIDLDLAHSFYYKWTRIYKDINLVQSGDYISTRSGSTSKKTYLISNLYLYGGCDLQLTDKLSANIDFCFSLGAYGAAYYRADLLGIGFGVKRRL